MKVLRGIVRWFGLIACCVLIPAQIVVALTNIVGRQFFIFTGTPLQELEWHLFVGLVFMMLGFTYLSDRHVRIDVLRERMSRRTRAWVEIVGFCVALLPFCLVIIYFGTDAAWRAFESGERSGASLGLPHRWIIKSTIPIGFSLLLMAGITIVVKNAALLMKSNDKTPASR